MPRVEFLHFHSHEESDICKIYEKMLDTYEKSSSYADKKRTINPLLTEFYKFYRENREKVREKYFLYLYTNLCCKIDDIPKNMLPKLDPKELKEKMSVRDMLDYIVYTARNNHINNSDNCFYANKTEKDRIAHFVNNNMLYGKSEGMTDEVIKICKELGIKAVKLQIGEDVVFRSYSQDGITVMNLGDETVSAENEKYRYCPHNFCMAEINGENYIIDCSYRQFCGLANRNLLVFGTVADGTPGAILMNNSKGEQLAGNLLRNGWIPCTEENWKMYLSSFCLSSMNNQISDPIFLTESHAKDIDKWIKSNISSMKEQIEKQNVSDFEIKFQEDKTNQMVRSRED